ncbi:MAG TPA: WYL domain-containing protein [Ignavibacteria bacterium]
MNNPMLARIFKIDELLRYKKKVTIKEILSATEVKNRKTIYNTIETMRQLWNAPIVYDQKNKWYYYSEENYKMQALNMSEGELFSLLVATKTLEQYKNTPFFDKLEKVFKRIIEFLPKNIKILPDELNNALHFKLDSVIDFSGEIFDIITIALKESWELEIEYSGLIRGKTEKRVIQPYFILNKHGNWYIFAFCKSRNDFRLFAIQRIKKAKLTNEVFIKDDEIDPNIIISDYLDQPGGKGSYYVEILIKHPTSLYVAERKWHKTQKIHYNDDDSIIISFTINSLKEVQRWILSMGSEAMVLKPKFLRNLIIEEIKKMQKNYR